MFRYVLTVLLLSACINSNASPRLKIINIVINANGDVFIGRDTLQVSQLAGEVQERLWKSYLGASKMYDSIKIVFIGDVLMKIRGAALEAIKLAQKNALTAISLEKHKRLFENCSSREQKKIRKQLPVLFQELH